MGADGFLVAIHYPAGLRAHAFVSAKVFLTSGGLRQISMDKTLPKQIKAANEAAIKRAGKGLVNRVSRRLWSLEAEELCERARRQTDLTDFGDPPLKEPLTRLVNSLEAEVDLHPLGRFLMCEHLLGLLKTRLRLADVWQRCPINPAAALIRRPVFITGMPRSGSTFLHELLSQDSDNRSPKVWEVMFPLPAPSVKRSCRDLRVNRAAGCLWCFRRLAPGADAVYPLRAETPQECIAIHSYTLLSEEFVATCRTPSYEHFLRSTGLGPAYVWEKRFLQHLQSCCPTEQWILKSPDHLWALEELFSVFPDAFIIQTHRNPLEVLESIIQLIKTLRGAFRRPDDAAELCSHETKSLAERIDLSIRFRDSHPAFTDRFIDVNYLELVSDPMAVIRRIYQRLGRPLTGQTAQRMNGLIATRSRYPRRHDPALAKPGFDVAAEVRRFQVYCQRFGVSCRQPVAS
jgi:LPS sulfotransferase NodH